MCQTWALLQGFSEFYRPFKIRVKQEKEKESGEWFNSRCSDDDEEVHEGNEWEEKRRWSQTGQHLASYTRTRGNNHDSMQSLILEGVRSQGLLDSNKNKKNARRKRQPLNNTLHHQNERAKGISQIPVFLPSVLSSMIPTRVSSSPSFEGHYITWIDTCRTRPGNIRHATSI